jgi:hypothetical protein
VAAIDGIAVHGVGNGIQENFHQKIWGIIVMRLMWTTIVMLKLKRRIVIASNEVAKQSRLYFAGLLSSTTLTNHRKLAMTSKYALLNTIIKKVLILAILWMLAIPDALSVRPFITDNAAITGFRRSELASWIFAGKTGTEFWHSANLGLTNWAELTIAGVWGRSKYDIQGETIRENSYTVPLVQAKFIIHAYKPNGLPGIGIAVGSDMPWGKGAFVPDGYGAFGCVLLTQCFGMDDNVLIHAQAGGTYLKNKASKEKLSGLVFGLGTQVKVYRGFHLIGEIVNGDPYEHGAGSMYQLGIRQFASDRLQFDLAFGDGISGDKKANSWVTCGVRYVLSYKKRGS